MAAVVSHAMRRYPLSPPDGLYSTYNVRSESLSWGKEEGESALSRSMRYADPWLYGSVRSPPGIVLAPAFVLCSCQEYLQGTKRGSKKGPTTCKKCKGARVPLSPTKDSKYGTVRCYPSAGTANGTSGIPIRAGTVRVSPTTRPSILPTQDPYDLMRRSRLSVPEGGSQLRMRSVSPSKGKATEGRSLSANRAGSSAPSSSAGRRSILECDINPYELMSAEAEPAAPKDITLVNGQRIRVRPPPYDPDVYDDVQPSPEQPDDQEEPVRKTTRESEQNLTFKSILKKRPASYSEPEPKGSVSKRNMISLRRKSGSHFYLPMPRKKVQFLVENLSEGGSSSENLSEPDNVAEEQNVYQDVSSDNSIPDIEDNKCYLRRSTSERLNHEQAKVVFLDTMALRIKTPRKDTRETFNLKDLERLDGVQKSKKVSETIENDNEEQYNTIYFKTDKGEDTEDFEKVVAEQQSRNMEVFVQQVAEKTIDAEPATKMITNVETENEMCEKINVLLAKTVNSMIITDVPPSAPPRKRSNSKPPAVNIINSNEVYSNVIFQNVEPKENITINVKEYGPNRTIVQLPPPVHKVQIKNEYSDPSNIQTISISENPQRKTSILITGDDCYCTVNVNDDVPLYQSSVVVKDTGDEASPIIERRSSSVYITGNFVKSTSNESRLNLTKELKPDQNLEPDRPSTPEMLREILRDPVEAVKRNLVPHVCGKSRAPRSRDKKINKYYPMFSVNESLLESLDSEPKNIDADQISEHSCSTQYEFVDPGSDCYTDHSNRSSVTEEELANRTKFYELLADAALAEVDDHHYESINKEADPIYEEIEIPPPLPSNPPPTSLLDDLKLDKEFTTRSIFEGASKYDILSYLVDAKERGIIPEDSYTFSNITSEKDNSRESHMSNVSDSSEDNSLLIDEKAVYPKTTDIERNDSGVGSETSKTSLSKYRFKPEATSICEDCDSPLDSEAENEPLLCRKCSKKRTERKEIIMEIVETEEKYSKDLQIVLEEFYQPMLVAGLLTPEQLSAIFLNVEELLDNSQALAEKLRDAVEIALENGDEDLLTVNMGKLFLESAPMLHAFETYCIRQGPASLLLASLEKEKELLRIFLKVSQMENTLLRRMNLNSFLMVPVQRVTKYPLLLARLYKVTPCHHDTREQLKEAQHKIELHLNHMNSETKDVPSKLWRRIGSSSGRRSSSEMDLVNIKLRKIAVDVLEWNHEEAKFALEGKLLFTQPTDNNWRKGRTIKLAPVNALLVINGKAQNKEREENSLVFPKHAAVREAALLLVRDKNGRYSLLRDPLYLDRCVIAADPAWQSYFEVQELLSKDTFIFKAEDEEHTKAWYQQLQFHAQGMGAWRKRRNALANIMMNGMGLRS